MSSVSPASLKSPPSPISPHSSTFPSQENQSALRTTGEGEVHRASKIEQFWASNQDTKHGTSRGRTKNVGGGKILKDVPADVNKDNICIDFPPYWLYPDPDTFPREGPSKTLHKEMTGLRIHLILTYDRIAPILIKGLTEYEQKFAFTSKAVNSTKVVDIGSRSKGADTNAQSKEHTFTSPEDLGKHLMAQRKREDAKKRFIHINSCSPQEAVVLYLGSPPSERYSTMGFIDRHCSGTNWVKDDVFKDANLWVTELHLSYFVLAQEGHIIKQDLTSSLHESLLRSRWSFASKLHDISHSLRRAAISFRFVGDAHDRWWTCYTLSYRPGSDEWFKPEKYAYKDRGDQKKRDPEDLHGQRKFIELALLEDITNDIVSSTQSILQLIDNTLGQGESPGSAEDDDFDVFSREFDAQKSHALSAEYVQFSKLLRIAQDNHRRVTETIDDWDQKEKQRKNQLRWSYEDEREYRRPLDLKTRELRRNVTKMKEQGEDITWKIGDLKDLRTILSADLSLREARVSTQSSEDVRLFTYVTVIFLPLSFSSSLFSMQGLPDNPVVTTFLILTICALFITLLVLVNLKTLNRIRGSATAKLFAKARKKMHTSVRHFWNRIGRDLDSVEKQTIHPYSLSISRRTSSTQGESIEQSGPMVVEKPVSHQSKWWYLYFWLFYLFLEAPAQRVDLAWQVLTLSKEKRKRLGPSRVAMHIIIGVLWLPILIPSHILWFAVINLLELPLLLYRHLSDSFHTCLEWLDREPPGASELVDGVFAGPVEPGDNMVADQGSSTSVDKRRKRTLSQITFRGQDEQRILEPNTKRIRGLSEPWKMSSAHPEWFKTKESAGANASMTTTRNNQAKSSVHGESSEGRNGDIWSSVFKPLTSLLPSGSRKSSQTKKENDDHNDVV